MRLTDEAAAIREAAHGDVGEARIDQPQGRPPEPALPDPVGDVQAPFVEQLLKPAERDAEGCVRSGAKVERVIRRPPASAASRAPSKTPSPVCRASLGTRRSYEMSRQTSNFLRAAIPGVVTRRRIGPKIGRRRSDDGTRRGAHRDARRLPSFASRDRRQVRRRAARRSRVMRVAAWKSSGLPRTQARKRAISGSALRAATSASRFAISASL
jgi:hypothetical protein